MFNTILTKIQGFFSPSFWLGSFLPVAVIGALHLLLIDFAFVDLVALKTWFKSTVTEKATGLTFVLIGMIVLAYVLTPFTSMFRELLDGRLLPDNLHDWLRNRRLSQWRKARAQRKAGDNDYAFFDRMKNMRIKEIWAAVDAPTGAQAGAVDSLRQRYDALGPNIDKARADCSAPIGPIDEAIKDMETSMLVTGLPDKLSTERAVDALIVALNDRSSMYLPRNLETARDQLVGLIDEARSEAAYRLARMPSAFLRTDLLPTRVGDSRREAERYSAASYGVEFDYVWPRIQMILPDKNDSFASRLRDAESQLNFAVLTLFLAVTLPTIWLPMLVITAKMPWLFLAVGVLSPLVILFLYEMVVQSQEVFSEVVRAAIDNYRLQVLTKVMHQPLPTTLAAERALWDGLKIASEPGNIVNMALVQEKD